MNKIIITVIAVISLAFTTVLKAEGNERLYSCNSYPTDRNSVAPGEDNQQPESVTVVCRIKPVILQEGLKFRDLNNNGKLDVYEDWRQPMDKRVSNLVSLMTSEELIGQLFYERVVVTIDGGAASIKVAEQYIKDKNIFAFANDGTAHPSVVAAYSNSIQEIAERTRLGIPVTFHSHGGRPDNSLTWTSFPSPLGMGAANDLDLIEKWGEILAAEYRAMGIHVRIYPMIDVATEPRWSRIQDLFSEDANKVADIALAYLKGSRGENGGPAIISEFKHFPGGGAAPAGKDPHVKEGSVYTFPGNNFEYHLIPWKAVINAGARRIMPYYYVNAKYNPNVAQSFSSEVLTDLLRNELGYDGIISSDWRAVSDRAYGVDTNIVNQKERYLMTFNAGMEDLAIGQKPELVKELVEEGKLPIKKVKEVVSKLLEDKFTLGLFDNPYVDPQKAAEIVGSKEHRAISMRAHRESTVLLTNNNDLLPLEAGKVDAQSGKIRCLKIFGYNLDTEVADNYGIMVDDPDEADLAIICVEPFGQGDQANPGTLAFPRGTEAIINSVSKSGVPTILAVDFVRPGVIPSGVTDAVDAMFARFGSNDTALLDIIFGRFNPTGKLPVQIPSSPESVQNQVEDVPFDIENPAFDFGFGLSYK